MLHIISVATVCLERYGGGSVIIFLYGIGVGSSLFLFTNSTVAASVPINLHQFLICREGIN